MASSRDRGPKSPWRLWYYLLILMNYTIAWPEGWCSSMGTPGMANMAMKTHGERPMHPHAGAPKKRSWRRALNRAQRLGCTVYKGQLLYAPTPPAENAAVGTPWKTSCRPPTKRYTIATWNGAGLNYEFIMPWLRDSKVDLAVFTETRCSWSSTWTIPGWHLVHSGCAHGGILVAVAAHISKPQDIAFEALQPGRLLHVRLHLSNWNLDILGTYQYAWAPELGKKTNLARRSEIWHALEQTLARLPNRNQLIVCGDFNTDLKPHGKLIGPTKHANHWTPDGRHKLQQDQSSFQDLVISQKLVALNTWSPNFAPTFKGNFGASTRIDFILMRLRDCDGHAKSCLPLPDCPLMHIKSGPQHHPVVGTIRYLAPHRLYPPQPHFTHQHRHQMYTHYLHNTTHWQTFKQHAQYKATHHPFPELNKELLQLSHQYFQPQQQTITKPWQHHDFQTHYHNIWHLHKQYSNLTTTTIPALFQAWHQITTLKKHVKQARQVAKQKKKAQLQQALNIAANFAYHKDTYNWFKCLQPLKRKQKAPTIQIRDSTGHITDPHHEGSIITTYLRKLYHDDNFTYKPPPSISNLPFSIDELTTSLHSISGRTAGPAHLAPNLAWRAAASELATTVYKQLQHLWIHTTPIQLPTDWITSWLILLPKPNKSPDKPEHLRPISLLHPISKAITKLLAHKARDHAFQQLCEMPQYAYLPRRSTRDALHRAFTHCREVRTLTLKQPNNTYHRYMTPEEIPTFVGGLQISLDLTKAFDSVPRSTLIQCLQQLQIPDNIKHPLIAFLAPSPCYVNHKQHQHHFQATRGLRQGSTDAPFAWSVLMWSICDHLSKSHGLEWVQQHVTIYADDILLQWKFHSHDDYLKARQDIVHFFTILQQHGMQVNMSKSALGTTYHIHTKHHHLQFPLKSKHEYLGGIISYGAFVKYTYHKRQTQAKTLCDQLRQILRDNHHHSLPQRLSLYDSSVKTCLQYATLVCGLTPQTAQAYHALIMQHYRYIAKSPLHITHETNQQLLQRLNRDPPLEQFDHSHQKWQMNQATVKHTLYSQDILHQQPQIPHPRPTPPTQDMEASQQTNPPDAPPADAPHPQYTCETCHRPFEDLPALRIHCTKLNHQLPPQHNTARPFNQHTDALEGLSQCAHCSQPFRTWTGLKNHITLGRCPKQPDQDIDTRPLVHRPSIALHIQALSYPGLFNDRTLIYEMVHTCVFCRKWHADGTSLSHHYRREHARLYAHIQDHLAEIRSHAYIGSGKGSCRLCGLTCTQLSKHRCPVAFQMTAMHIAHNVHSNFLREYMHPDENMEDSAHKCKQCGTICKTALGLKQHYGTTKCKPTQTPTTHFTCHLCNTTYKNQKGLQRHNKRQHPEITNLPSQQNTLLNYIQSKPTHTDTPLTLCHTPTTTTDLLTAKYKDLKTHISMMMPHLLPQDKHTHDLLLNCQHTIPTQHWSILQYYTPCQPIASKTLNTQLQLYLHLHHHTPFHPSPNQLWLKPTSRQKIRYIHGHGLNLRGRTHGFAQCLPGPMALSIQTTKDGSPCRDLQPQLGTSTPYRPCPNRHTAHAGDGTLDTSPRADVKCALPRHGSHDVHSLWTGIRHSALGQSITGLEASPTVQSGHTDTTHHPAHTHPAGATNTPQKSTWQQPSRRADEQPPQQGLHTQQALGIPYVGQQPEAKQTDIRSSHIIPGGRANPGNGTATTPDTHHQQMPGPSILDKHQQRGHTLEDQLQFAHLPGQDLPRGHDQTHPLFHHTTHPDQTEGALTTGVSSSQPGTSSTDGSTGQLGQGQGQRQERIAEGRLLMSRLKHLALTNDANWCWLNALYLSYGVTFLEWFIEGHFDMAIPGVYEQLLNRMPQPLMHIKDLVDISSLGQQLTNVWVDQQDAGEAAHHWLNMLGCTASDMGWHLRRGLQILDSGGFRMPIHLPLPAGRQKKWRLQHLIKCWHNDSRGTQALVKAPPIICFQLGRFHDTNLRRQDLVYWDFSTVQVPFFSGNDDQVLWCYYKIRAGLLHYGTMPTTGHYQAFAVTPNEDYLLWDDDHPPMSESNLPLIFQQVVIIWATLAEPCLHADSEAESLTSVKSTDQALEVNNLDLMSHAESIDITRRKRVLARRHRRLTRQKTTKGSFSRPTTSATSLGALLETTFAKHH